MRFELDFRVPAPLDRVARCLVEPEHFVATHPLITALTPGEAGFIVSERVRVLGIPYRFEYPASITYDAASGVVVIVADVRRTTRIRMTFTLTAEDGGTRVVEEVELTAPWGVRGYLARVVRTTHTRWFDAIAEAVRQEA